MLCTPSRATQRLLRRSLVVALVLAVAACGESPVGPATPESGTASSKSSAPLKATPPQVKLSGIGATGTVTATSIVSGPITAAISVPACASVSPRTVPKTPAKFTVTGTAGGNCTLNLTDNGGHTLQIPVTVAATVAIVRRTLVAGKYHSCGLTSAGTAYCWGLNDFGQLGTATNLGTRNPNPTPIAVSGNLTFVSLAAGSAHTCGLTGTGAAYCWGSNYYGELGSTTNNGTLTPLTTPQPVSGGLILAALTAGGTTYFQDEPGGDFTCGLTTAGAAYCWGRNDYGELGTSTNSGTLNANPSPLAVSGNLTFTALEASAAGGMSTCGLTASGAAYCWGSNYYGQLGNATGVGTQDATTTPTAVDGNLVFAGIRAGASNGCGLVAGGTAYCWGSNFSGEVGTATNVGTNTPIPTPTAVSGGLSFTTLSVGGGYSCGLAGGGAAYCWGANIYSELGIGSTDSDPHSSPLAVTGNLALVSLSSGPFHTCGLTAAGAAYCWGDNYGGELGTSTSTGTNTGIPSPVAVGGGLTFALP